MSVSEVNPENIELQSEKSTISKAVTIKHYGGGADGPLSSKFTPTVLQPYVNF